MIDIKEDTKANENNVNFGKAEEEAIISLFFDQSEFMSVILPYLSDDYFEQFHTKFVFNLIKYHFDKNNVILSRGLCTDIASKYLTADDPYKEILALIKRESDPREVPILTEKLVDWTKKKAYGKLYSEDIIDAHNRGEYDKIENIIEEARKISEHKANFHFFFKETDMLFERENEEKLTTGFPKLDAFVNQGGPTRGDVLCWMAPTGVGKSIALVNSGACCIKRSLNVLHVTLEMPWKKIGLRYMGCFTDIWIKNRFNDEDNVRKRLSKICETYDANLIIVEYPPDEITVDVLQANVDTLRRLYGIVIDVIIIDYLEILMSRIPSYNKEDYTRQKRCATELCRLAKKTNTLVFTAIQTNRSGNDNLDSKGEEKVIELNKVAESYGKIMPVDYLITINQTRQEYEDGKSTIPSENNAVTGAKCRLYIAKNRNGPKFELIEGTINYETMKMREFSSNF